jgi:hypothetical protein
LVVSSVGGLALLSETALTAGAVRATRTKQCLEMNARLAIQAVGKTNWHCATQQADILILRLGPGTGHPKRGEPSFFSTIVDNEDLKLGRLLIQYGYALGLGTTWRGNRP